MEGSNGVCICQVRLAKFSDFGSHLTSSYRSDFFPSYLDYTGKVWNIDNGTLLHSLDRHIEPVSRIILLQMFGCLVTAVGEIRSCEVAPSGTIVVGDGLRFVHFLALVEPV